MLSLNEILEEDAKGENSSLVKVSYIKAMNAGTPSEDLVAAFVCFLVIIANDHRAEKTYNQYPVKSLPLRLEIIRTLLCRALIDWAQELLAEITEDSPEISFLKNYAEHLRLARDEFAVFPIHVNPFTALHSQQLNHNIVADKIMAGRFDGYEDDSMFFTLARLNPQGKNEYHQFSISEADYRKWGGDADFRTNDYLFVEIIQQGEAISLRCHPTRDLTEEEQKFITPALDSHRYLRSFFRKQDDNL